jgi:hypothetical protein
MKRTVTAAALLLALASCSSDTVEPGAGDVIGREAFIATYVELRRAAIGSPDFRVSPGARAEILARHGVEAEDLVRFAEAYGRDLELMNEVWTEVEARIQDSGADATPP